MITELIRFSDTSGKIPEVVSANAGAPMPAAVQPFVEFFTTGYNSKKDTHQYTTLSQYKKLFANYFVDPSDFTYLSTDVNYVVAVKGADKVKKAIAFLANIDW